MSLLFRIVHFVRADGSHTSALIVALRQDRALGQVALLYRGGIVTSAFFDPDVKNAGTWHWDEATTRMRGMSAREL